MKAVISNSLLLKLKPTGKQYDVRDSKLTGFMIRVTSSGKMNYVCEYKRGRRINLGNVEVLTSAQARDKAKEILGDATKAENDLGWKRNISFQQLVERMVESDLKKVGKELD